MSNKRTGRSTKTLIEDINYNHNKQDSKSVPIKVPYGINQAISEEAKRIGATKGDMIRILWEFYCLDHLDVLVRRIRENYVKGFSPVEVANLSVLYSFLSYINMRSKMLE
jgi:hypothetical protein